MSDDRSKENEVCEACERGEHHNCGMQTWCKCDCDGIAEEYLRREDEAVDARRSDYMSYYP